ncbi:MAG: ABC transporter ATP-binding protein [Clostridia bacterium]|nr:ABC transporter ATP-binding protein [Clostridia bacterium]
MSEKNKPAKALPTLRRCLALNVRLRMKRSRSKALVTLIVFMLPGTLEALAVPALERFIEGVAQAAQRLAFGPVVLPALVMAAVHVCVYASQHLCYYWRDVYTERLNADLSAALMRSVARKEPVCFENTGRLDALEKAQEGVTALNDVCSLIFEDGAWSLMNLAALTIWLALRNALLACLLPLTCLPMIASQLLLQKFSFDVKEKQAPISRATAYCEQAMTSREMFKETRVLGAFGYFHARYRRHLKEYARLNRGLMLKSTGVSLAANLVSLTGFVGMLVLMLFELRAGRIETAAFAALFAGLLGIYQSICVFFMGFGEMIATNLPQAGNLFKVLDMPEREGEAGEADGGKGVTLENVRFRYPGAENEAVRGVSLDIKPGETVAVVGENGAGKTTLVRLMTGLYLPDSGAVRIGGKDTRKIDLPSAVKRSSAVFQKYAQYKLTLGENVRASDMAGDARSAAAPLRDAGLPADSACFPEGEKTMLSREFDGVDLSGGQWQRVAIARGLYRAHGLIVLDEPTAAIDPLEETRVYQKFAALSKNSTAVIVTHRMGSARIADRIVVMKDGAIDDIGTHDELMARGGVYADMVAAQAEWYAQAAPAMGG